MKPNLNEYVIAYLTMLSGLAVSSVAVYYSVSGLATIFSAAVIPIIVMGVALEVGKIIATLWLKQNWNTAPWSIKIYLSAAVTILMFITAMGEFGFLSKSHADQAVPNVEFSAKIQEIDQKIQVEKDIIEVDRKSLAQLDSAVDQVIARTTDEHGIEKSNAIRKSQQKERAHLTEEISLSQHNIAALNKERAPIAGELRKVESEVGPIRYIAAFFYGQTDQAVLEKAVTWVIIMIISVFDPLALILLLASQVSFIEIREKHLRYNQEQEHLALLNPTSAQRTVDRYDDELTDEQLSNIRASAMAPSGAGVILGNIFEHEDHEDHVGEDGLTQGERAFFKRARTVARKLDEEAGNTQEPTVEVEKRPSSGIPLTDAATVERAPVPMSISSGSPIVKYKVFPRPKQTEKVISKPEEVETQEELPVDKEVVQNDPIVAKDYVIEENEVKVKVDTTSSTFVLPSSYIQNEEQSKSNLWSNTTTNNNITQEEYLQASNEKLEEHMSNFVKDIKSGNMQITEIPSILVQSIKSRI